MVQLNVDGIIEKNIYEKKYYKIKTEMDLAYEEINTLGENQEETDLLKKKMDSFRKVFERKKLLKEFDREVFENVIDRVIIGKTDDETGIRYPYSVTFIFKAGLELEKDCNAKKPEGMHGTVGNTVCSFSRHLACGDGGMTTKDRR